MSAPANEPPPPGAEEALAPGATDSPALVLSLQRKIAGNWLQVFSGSLVASILNFLSFVLLSRSLPVEFVGIIAVIQTYWRLIEGFLSFRSFNVLISYGAQSLEKNDRADYEFIVRTCFIADVTVAICGSLLGVIGLMLFAQLINIPVEFEGSAMIAALMLVHIVASAPSGILRLSDSFYIVAAAEVLTAALRLIAAGTGFFYGLGWTYFLLTWVLAQLVGDLITIAASGFVLKRDGFKPWDMTPSAIPNRAKTLVKSLLAVNLTSMVTIMSEEGDVMFVNTVLGAAAAGYYKVAKNFAGIIHRLTGPLNTVIYPEISRLIAAKNKPVFKRLVRDVNIGCGLFAIAALIGWLLLGHTVLHYTVSSQFADVYSTVAIQLSALAVVFFGHCCWPTLLSLQRYREILFVNVVSTSTFFLVGWLTMPTYGVNGAAIAQLVCYAVEVILAFTIINAILKNYDWETPQGRPSPAPLVGE